MPSWNGRTAEPSKRQYANILWLSHILRRLRGDIDVLLRGNAVRYALNDQPRTRLAIGSREVDTLPHYETEIRNLLKPASRYMFECGLRQLRHRSDAADSRGRAGGFARCGAAMRGTPTSGTGNARGLRI